LLLLQCAAATATPQGSELGTSALKKVFSGDSPVGTVHIHFRHHKIEDIPTEDEKVSKWAMDMWRTKDDLLQTLQTTGRCVWPWPLKTGTLVEL